MGQNFTQFQTVCGRRQNDFDVVIAVCIGEGRAGLDGDRHQ